MKTLLLAVLLCMTSIAYGAPSEPPIPSAPKAGEPQKANTTQAGDETANKAKDSDKLPFVFNVYASPKTETCCNDKTEKGNEEPAKNWVFDALIALGTIALAFITGWLAYYTRGLWRTTVDLSVDSKTTADATAQKMEASIAQAGRAANAMESVAKATIENTANMQKQLRAYVSVGMGVPACQTETLNFAGSPVLINNGYTPAKNVSHKLKVDILDLSSAPANYEFDESAGLVSSDAVLFPRDSFVMNSVMSNRFTDDQVTEIMAGKGKRLFVWGVVTYDDIFGNSWETKFCHNFMFYKEGEIIKFLGYYFRIHNSAT